MFFVWAHFEIIEFFFFLSEQANFSASTRPKRNFPTVQNCLKERKNLYFRKLVSKWKTASRNGHTNFFVFHFWNFKLVAIDSALNEVFNFSKMWVWNREKQPSLEIWVEVFLKHRLALVTANLESSGTKLFAYWTDQDCWLQHFLC